MLRSWLGGRFWARGSDGKARRQVRVVGGEAPPHCPGLRLEVVKQGIERLLWVVAWPLPGGALSIGPLKAPVGKLAEAMALDFARCPPAWRSAWAGPFS